MVMISGDAVLKEIASRLRRTVRPHDVVCRYGGDEFLVFLENCYEKGGSVAAERILDGVRSEPITLGSVQLDVTMSLGWAWVQSTKQEVLAELIKTADMALYEAKAAGRDRAERIKLDLKQSNAA